ncbi:MAG: flavodoxin [Lachnospiraceae bacterium]|nr:flavodoxin [Lachnospiraceae bacterium]
MKYRRSLTLTAALLAALCLVFGAAACGSGDTAGQGHETTAAVPAETVNADAAETPAEASAAAETPENEETPAPAAETPAAGSDVLVVYFSVTGNTRGVAERMAAILGADTAEIVPAQPYTDEDIDYSSDEPRRSRIEADDPASRPEIGGDEISLEGCGTVYLGYPIWYGQEPRILDTFVEAHDFTGITVIPFCTSGSSGIGSTGSRLAELAGTGDWLEGQRFSGSVSDEELRAWIEGLS